MKNSKSFITTWKPCIAKIMSTSQAMLLHGGLNFPETPQVWAGFLSLSGSGFCSFLTSHSRGGKSHLSVFNLGSDRPVCQCALGSVEDDSTRFPSVFSSLKWREDRAVSTVAHVSRWHPSRKSLLSFWADGAHSGTGQHSRCPHPSCC